MNLTVIMGINDGLMSGERVQIESKDVLDMLRKAAYDLNPVPEGEYEIAWAEVSADG